MLPSSPQDMLVRAGGDTFPIRLADAGEIRITGYSTGYKTGIKLLLDRFRNTGQASPGATLGLRLVLTLCLEGPDEELVSEITAIERDATVRELNWPKAFDGREVDYTIISSGDGTLPRLAEILPSHSARQGR